MAGNDISILIRQLQRMKNEWPQILKNVGQQACDIAVSKAVEEMVSEIRPKFDEVVDTFYGSYSPRYYERRETMYDILELEAHFTGSQAQLTLDYNGDDMTFRNGEPGLMELTFGEGYHGGASGTDRNGTMVTSPHYRQPPYLWSEWGRPAEYSDPPYDAFIDWLTEYWEGPTFQKLFERYCASEFEKGLSYNLLFT